MKPTGESPPGIGTRVRIEGVVVGREKCGVSVRLPEGTIQSFSDLAVSIAEPESLSAGDSRRGICTRLRIEGVVVGREKYGVSVRLPDGTIRSFSDLAVSPAEQDEIASGEGWDEAGVVAAEQRIDYLKAELDESSCDIHENHLRFD
jgi:hypothetical protein